MTIFNLLSILALMVIVPCGAYLWFLALASIRTRKLAAGEGIRHRFAIAIPAHDEADVIGHTVVNLKRFDYPADLFDIFVVADFCQDETARSARMEGAVCFERTTGDRNGKGGALLWLFDRIFECETSYDAIVIFDADTRVDPDFLNVMNRRLNQGAVVIQGKHVISNPQAGMFPGLTWAMMAIDNRFNNLGRANLHVSAKLMGDSICFRTDVIRKYGWGAGLTEDHDLRMHLLMEGILIDYEPSAVGFGQAPAGFKEAEAQRLRWAKGMMQVNRRYRWSLLRAGLRKPLDWNKIDGAVLSTIPSYSTLSLLSSVILLLHLVFRAYVSPALIWVWLVVALVLFVYPLFGLFLERAPLRAYMLLLSGPLFIVWRTWLRMKLRFSKKKITWLRTSHNARNFH